MTKIKIQINLNILFLLVLCGGMLLTTGYAQSADGYRTDSVEKQPKMGLSEAIESIKRDLHKMVYQVDEVHVTSEGFSFRIISANNMVASGNNIYSANFNDYQTLSLSHSFSYQYYIRWNSNLFLRWENDRDGQNFIDAIDALKRYTSKQSIADDVATFADFQEKVKAWQVLPQKPPLPEEARRFRVLADDAVQNKDFERAADYYEQGLAIDPMWSAGQFNVAIIYAELKAYPMAVMHMKRYLLLKPDAKDAKAYQDKIYIWESKVDEGKGSSDNPNTQSARPSF